MPERFDPHGYIQRAFDFEAELGTTEEVRKLHRLHESLAPYLDTQQLRQLVAYHGDLRRYCQSLGNRAPRQARTEDVMAFLVAAASQTPAEIAKASSSVVLPVPLSPTSRVNWGCNSRV